MEIANKRKLSVVIAVLVGFSILMPVEVSAASKVASKPGQVKSLKVSSKSYSSLKISWKKVKGAKGYQVYRASSKNGKYKKVKTTRSSSWTNSKLTTGKKYYYKVRAYKSRTKGKFSSKKSGSPQLTKPKIKVASAGSQSIRVSWGKVSGAKGYQLYRAASKNGTYAKIKTTTATNYTNGSLSAGKTYYYKARAYRRVGNTTRYSSYSPVVSASTAQSTSTPAPPENPKPVTPEPPSTPSKEAYLKVLDAANNEVTNLEAGKTYELQCSGSWSMSNDGEDSTEAYNKAMAYWHIEPMRSIEGYKAIITPVVAGNVYIITKDGMRQKYTIIKGTIINAGGLNIELGGNVPSGYSEYYDTIYGYRQYVYNKDTENLVLVGAEDGKTKTVFVMADYTVGVDEDYLDIQETSFGATTISLIRYYSDCTPKNKILSGTALKNLGHEANLIGNALRDMHDKAPMTENANLTEAAAANVEKLYKHYGNTVNWNIQAHQYENDDFYFDACGSNYTFLSDNIYYGDKGLQSVAVSAMEGIYASAGHRAYLLSDQAEIVGSAFLYDGYSDVAMIQAYAYAK